MAVAQPALALGPRANDVRGEQARRSGRRRRPLGRACAYVLLVAAGIIAAAPFVWMILSSFKTGAEIRQTPPTFIPRNPTLDNYRTILDDPDLPLWRFYRNSAIIASANVGSALFTSSLLGYIFAKFTFRANKAMFWYLLATMMVPAQLTMIPSYLILVRLGLINSLWGLIVPVAVDAFGVFLMRQFCLSIPNSLIKAARVDGASEWRIYRSIVLPHLKPALAVLGLLTFMAHWNAYLWPLVVLTEDDKRTLPIILTWYSNKNSSRLQLVMAASVLIVIPVVIAFGLVQKWIVKGITFTGIR